MLVEDWMTTGAILIRADDSVDRAIRLQRDHSVRMIPVVDEGKLVGVVTDKDLVQASLPSGIALNREEADDITSNIKIRKVMTGSPITIMPDHTMDEATEIILKSKIHGAPVIDENKKIVGVLTLSDVLRFLMSMTGEDKIGYQFSFSLPDESGYIAKIIDLVKEYNGRIWTISCSYSGVPQGFRNVFMRIYDVAPKDIPDLTDKIKQKVKLRYFVDFKQDSRTIFDKQKS